jgi:uncharacterized damage-inducible protein DinB
MRAPLSLPEHPTTSLGLLLAQLEDGRMRTLREVAKAPAERLHWSSTEFPNSLAAHLAHLAAIELDWLYCDLLGVEIPAEALESFPIEDVRGEDGQLAQAESATLPELLAALARARYLLLTECGRLEESELGDFVQGLEGAATPEWILSHLLQHEAEHRGVLRRMIASWSLRG